MEKIFIYGAGNYCASVVSRLIIDYEIIGIVDKDRKKQGNILFGRYCINGVEALLSMECAYIVVSVRNYFEDIKKELLDMGIPIEKIKNYDEMYDVVDPLDILNRGEDIEKNKKKYSVFQNRMFYSKVYDEYKGNIRTESLDIAFIVPEPQRQSGGHRNIYRAIHYLYRKGHRITVYYTDCAVHADIVKYRINEWFYDMGDIPFLCYDGSMGKHDACVATWWKTAYAMMDNRNNFKQMFHFVQDNEASFYSMSSNAILAENTYKQDYKYICSGPWMAAFLQNKYHARADYFQFPVNKKIYNMDTHRTKKNRNIIFFAKPEMPRRCYEIGIAALAEVHRRMPEVEIILFGSNRVEKAPFPVTKAGILPTLAELAELYRNADLGIVFSPTNPSLVPYEMMHCGCPVADMNLEYALSKYGDDENNVFLLDTRPERMGVQICEIMQNAELMREKREHAYNWAVKEFPTEDEMGEIIEKIIADEMKIGK